MALSLGLSGLLRSGSILRGTRVRGPPRVRGAARGRSTAGLSQLLRAIERLRWKWFLWWWRAGTCSRYRAEHLLLNSGL